MHLPKEVALAERVPLALAYRARRAGRLARGAAGRVRRRAEAATERLARADRSVATGTVALTFDDGPQPGSTDRVLDALAELQVRATFFCVGKNARAHPQLVRRIDAEGHAIGSHSMTHPHPRALSLRQLAAEYADGRAVIEDILGRAVPLFRPPHGHLNPASAFLIRRQGLQPWLWSVDPTDWRPGISTAQITSVAVRAGSGDVVLFHDWVEQPWAPAALDRSATIGSLPMIVADLRRRGLTFVPVRP